MNNQLTMTALGALLLAQAPLQAGPPLVQGKETKRVEEPVADGWQFKLALPAWIATSRGDTGINGSTAHSNTGFNEIVNKVDMVGAVRGEVSKGRFGALLDFSYFSLSDSVGVDGAVRGINVQADEMLGELGFRWRFVDAPRGSFDVLAGVRYTYLHEQISFQGNDQGIALAANRLALAGTLLRVRVAEELASLNGKDQQSFGRASLTSGETARLVRALAAIEGNTAERAEKIEKALRKALNGRASRTDQWFDPYIGVRGRLDLNDKFYITGRADISPFDVGADFAWQASAGFGWQLTPRVYYELVYRILDVEYRHDGFIYDTTAHGPEATLGITF
jgi:hypothetical protein